MQICCWSECEIGKMKTNEQLVHVFWWECCDIHILSGSHCLHEDMRSSATTSVSTAVV